MLSTLSELLADAERNALGVDGSAKASCIGLLHMLSLCAFSPSAAPEPKSHRAGGDGMRVERRSDEVRAWDMRLSERGSFSTDSRVSGVTTSM